jgi:hypothetical protein
LSEAMRPKSEEQRCQDYPPKIRLYPSERFARPLRAHGGN